MTKKREKPYIWGTWMAKQMSGDVTCDRQSWLKSNYTGLSKKPFDATQWQIRHTRGVKELSAEVERKGWKQIVEGQASFKYREPTGVTIAGRPDLVAFDGKTFTVFDVKTGRPRASDTVQVMLYMHYLPLVGLIPEGYEIRGEVVYSDHRVPVAPEAVGAEFTNHLQYYLGLFAQDVEPVARPSADECRFCDITSADCPQRVEAASAKAA